MLEENETTRVAHNAPHSPADRAIERVINDPALYQAVGARLWALAEIPDDKDDCWVWLGAKRGKSGYGNFKIVSNVTVSAHRLSYAMVNGKTPGDLMVCHRCDNPGCINPGHLFLGTHDDNMADMVAKGRSHSPESVGAKNPYAKLTEDQARQVIEMLASGMTNKSIAAEFGVTHAAISRIRMGKSWTHLPRPREFKRYGSLFKSNP